MINCEETEAEDAVFVEMDSANKYAILKADKTFAKGQQITESYGKKSNSELLRYEGFIIDDEQYMVNDCVYVYLPIPNGEEVQRVFRLWQPSFCFSVKRLEQNMWPSKDSTSYNYLAYLVMKDQGLSVNSIDDVHAKAKTWPGYPSGNPAFRKLLSIFEQQQQAFLSNKRATEEQLTKAVSDNAKLAIRFQLFEKRQIDKMVRALRNKLN